MLLCSLRPKALVLDSSSGDTLHMNLFQTGLELNSLQVGSIRYSVRNESVPMEKTMVISIERGLEMLGIP